MDRFEVILTNAKEVLVVPENTKFIRETANKKKSGETD